MIGNILVDFFQIMGSVSLMIIAILSMGTLLIFVKVAKWIKSFRNLTIGQIWKRFKKRVLKFKPFKCK